MKHKNIFVACDSSNLSEIKKIIKQTQTNKLKVVPKFGLQFFYSKNGRKFLENYFSPMLKTSSGWLTLEEEISCKWTKTSNSPLTLKKHPKELYPLTSAPLMISPTLYFSIIFALSSFLNGFLHQHS